MESLVVTLETAKKLKAAGFSQTGIYYAYDELGNGGFAARPYHSISAFYRHNCPTAPTAQEIADQLPNKKDFPHDWELTVERASDEKFAAYMNCASEYDGDEVAAYSVGDTMAEALAALWLKLQEVQS